MKIAFGIAIFFLIGSTRSSKGTALSSSLSSLRGIPTDDKSHGGNDKGAGATTTTTTTTTRFSNSFFKIKQVAAKTPGTAGKQYDTSHRAVLAVPTATNDEYTMTAGTTKTFPVNRGVLENDTPGEAGHQLKVVDCDQFIQGHSGICEDYGGFEYTPEKCFFGHVQFRYKVCDIFPGWELQCAFGTVSLTVNRPTSSPPKLKEDDVQSKAVFAGESAEFSMNVVDIDSLPGLKMELTGDGGNLFEWKELETGKGQLKFLGTSTEGAYIATVKVSDCWSEVQYRATIVVLEKKRPVVKDDVGYTMVAGTTKEVPKRGLLTNDRPGEPGHDIEVKGCDICCQGHAGVCNPDGGFTFTPDKCYIGTTNFPYEVCDTTQGWEDICSSGSVSIKVTKPDNSPPRFHEPDNQIKQIYAGESKTFTVTVDDLGLSQPLLTMELTQNDNGVYEWDESKTNPGSGVLTFLGASVADSYIASIKVSDCWSSVLFSVTVTVAKKNPPIVLDDAYSMVAGNTLLISPPVDTDLLDNDKAGELGHDIEVKDCDEYIPGHGGHCYSDGGFSYTPEECFVGKARFRYMACDTKKDWDDVCSYGDVSVEITRPENSPPKFKQNNNQVRDIFIGETTKFPVSVLDDGLPWIKIVLAKDEEGLFTWTENNDKRSGVLKFLGSSIEKEYHALVQVSDCWSWVFFSVTVKVHKKEPPVVGDDVYSILAGTTLTESILSNDKPGDSSHDLGVLKVIGCEQEPDFHTVSCPPTGSLQYTPPDCFFGPVSFKYNVCDTTPGWVNICSLGTISIMVNKPVISPPELVEEPDQQSKEIFVTEKWTFTVTVKYDNLLKLNLNHTRNDDNLFAWTETSPGVGKLEFLGTDKPDRYIAYIEVSDCWITTFFSFTVDVIEKRSPIARLDDEYTMTAGDAGTTLDTRTLPAPKGLLNNDEAGKVGHNLTVINCTQYPEGHVVHCKPNGEFNYTPSECFVGRSSFLYKVCDTAVGWKDICSFQSASILVNKPWNSPPKLKYGDYRKLTVTIGTSAFFNMAVKGPAQDLPKLNMTLHHNEGKRFTLEKKGQVYLLKFEGTPTVRRYTAYVNVSDCWSSDVVSRTVEVVPKLKAGVCSGLKGSCFGTKKCCPGRNLVCKMGTKKGKRGLYCRNNIKKCLKHKAICQAGPKPWRPCCKKFRCIKKKKWPTKRCLAG